MISDDDKRLRNILIASFVTMLFVAILLLTFVIFFFIVIFYIKQFAAPIINDLQQLKSTFDGISTNIGLMATSLKNIENKIPT